MVQLCVDQQAGLGKGMSYVDYTNISEQRGVLNTLEDCTNVNETGTGVVLIRLDL